MVDGNKIIIIFYFIYCVCANYECYIMPSRGPDLENKVSCILYISITLNDYCMDHVAQNTHVKNQIQLFYSTNDNSCFNFIPNMVWAFLLINIHFLKKWNYYIYWRTRRKRQCIEWLSATNYIYTFRYIQSNQPMRLPVLKRSPFFCLIIENFMWIEPLLRGHQS
jgi:hypothetical protein